MASVRCQLRAVSIGWRQPAQWPCHGRPLRKKEPLPAGRPKGKREVRNHLWRGLESRVLVSTCECSIFCTIGFAVPIGFAGVLLVHHIRTDALFSVPVNGVDARDLGASFDVPGWTRSGQERKSRMVHPKNMREGKHRARGANGKVLRAGHCRLRQKSPRSGGPNHCFTN